MCRIDDCQDRCDGPHRHRQRGIECPDATLAVQSISTLFLRPGNKSSSVSIPSPPSLITQALTGKSLPPPPSFAPDLLCRDPFLNFFPFLLPSLILYPFPPLSHATNDASLPFQPGLGGGGGAPGRKQRGEEEGRKGTRAINFWPFLPPFSS